MQMQNILAKLPRVGRSFFRNFPSLRRVQIEAMSPILLGENLVLVSSTGSGKTEAVIAPLAEKAIDQTNSTYCIYICPTRALVNDICSRLNSMFSSIERDTGYSISVGIRTGDRNDTGRRECLSFLITTPESLDVMISNRYDLIRTVHSIVLDDVHELYGTPRGLQLKVLIERLKKFCCRDIQCIAMSATIAEPNMIADWLFGPSEKRTIIVDGTRKNATFQFKKAEIAELPQIIYGAFRKGHRKILVFANTRKECDDICGKLRAFPGFGERVFLHYSSLDRQIREETEHQLLVCPKAVCITTSTLELGIDIGDIDLIVMFRPPHTVFSFLQRLGRGNRRTAQSKAILVYNKTLDLLKFTALIELANENLLENRRQIAFYSVVVQQVFSIINGSRNYKSSEEKLYASLCCLDFLSKAQMHSILSTLVQKQYLEYDYKSGLYSPAPKLKGMIQLGLIYGNISSRNESKVLKDASGNLGTIPGQSQLMSGDVVLFGGRFWEVLRSEENEVIVKECPKIDDPIRIEWTGSGFPVGREIAERIKQQLKQIKPMPAEMDNLTQVQLDEIKARSRGIDNLDSSILHEENCSHIYYTFLGELANKITVLVLKEKGEKLQTDIDGIGISSNSRLDFSRIPEEKEISNFILREYDHLSHILSPTMFYYMLPPDLRQKEVTSFIGVDEISKTVASLRKKKVRDFRLGIR